MHKLVHTLTTTLLSPQTEPTFATGCIRPGGHRHLPQTHWKLLLLLLLLPVVLLVLLALTLLGIPQHLLLPHSSRLYNLVTLTPVRCIMLPPILTQTLTRYPRTLARPLLIPVPTSPAKSVANFSPMAPILLPIPIPLPFPLPLPPTRPIQLAPPAAAAVAVVAVAVVAVAVAVAAPAVAPLLAPLLAPLPAPLLAPLPAPSLTNRLLVTRAHAQSRWPCPFLSGRHPTPTAPGQLPPAAPSLSPSRPVPRPPRSASASWHRSSRASATRLLPTSAGTPQSRLLPIPARIPQHLSAKPKSAPPALALALAPSIPLASIRWTTLSSRFPRTLLLISGQPRSSSSNSRINHPRPRLTLSMAPPSWTSILMCRKALPPSPHPSMASSTPSLLVQALLLPLPRPPPRPAHRRTAREQSPRHPRHRTISSPGSAARPTPPHPIPPRRRH